MSGIDRVVAIDVGGTKLAVAVVDDSGVVHSKIKLAVAKRNVEESIGQICSAAGEALQAASLGWQHVARVGLAIPGIYFAETGNAWAPNLWGWDQVPLRDELRSRLPLDVVIDSDRAAYVVGEQWLGRARGLEHVVFLAVGTGIGAGIISGGKLVRGAGDIAGAVGWFAVSRETTDVYRQTGSLEAEAAGPAVARRAREMLASGEASLIRESAGGAYDTVTTEMVVEAARRGDELARKVMLETAAYLAMGIANIISILNPQMVVLGGGLMRAGDLLLEEIRTRVTEWAQPIAATQVRIELSELGEDAGLLGAARLALLSA